MNRTIIRPLSTLLMGSTYLLSEFVQADWVSILVSLFALTTIITYMPYLKRIPFILISALLGSAFLIFIFGDGLWDMFLGLNTNVSVLAIFIFVPLLSIPIKRGRYLEYLETVFNHYIKTTGQLYSFVKIALMGVGSVINLGTVPIMYQLTDTASYQPYRMLRARALGRGFAMAFMWSPYFISVALILSYFDVSWIQIFPIGLSMAIIGIFLGILFERKHSTPIEMNQSTTDETISVKEAKRKLMELLVIILCLTALIMTIEYIVDLSVLTIIPLIAIVMSAGWGLVYESPRDLIKSYGQFTQERLPAMGNELSLFIAAGAFGAAILSAGASEWIIDFINFFGISHILVLIPVLLIIVNVLSFIGVHPIITMTALAITLSASPIFADDHLLLSFGLLANWMVSVIGSPFSGLNLLLSGLANSNPVAVGPRSNLLFALTLWFICYLTICLLYFVL
ncbi:hypothetical protein [Alkalibacillus almallahensis]|uniref:hypothetical protein n=1 Tax=Alkalibacillus almallahensis TaxID=1379154 RepID=UPI00141F7E3E|nr:hypothetical protein [Alkalibacillus almallahensis]NIK12465.1 hypothetical protein [Alkalibacillus almallahensis]